MPIQINCWGWRGSSQEPAILTFEIRPPFWRTYWAYILYLLAAAAAVYQFYQYQLRRVQLHNKLLYEQRETERLLALDELKNRFFSNVTHEFRTPLTLILEPARQLLKELTDNSALQKASIIESNSQKLLQLVNQLLDLSKIESGSMKVELQHGDLIEVIQPIYRSFLSLTQKKEIQFTWNYPHNLPTIAFDRDKIEKILHNLLSNALKFTPKQGEIHLTTTIYQHNLCIVVKDSGVGISNENLQKIFQRFYQADNTITRKSEGSGVGLALVKELVDLLNGKIEVESEIEKGTTFSIILPITNNIAQNITISKPEISEFQSFTDIDFRGEESLIPTQKGLILLVEDNSDMRFFIKQSVEAKGYKVMEAENGLAGVEKAFELIPDLIISDVMMPEKDGYDLTRTLKTDIRTSHIPIILLTAKSSLDSKLIGLEVGADAYIGKPFHTEELLIRIERLIELRKILQSKYFPSQGNSSTLMVTDEAETDNHESTTSEKTNVLVLSQLDKKFLAHIHEIIEQNLDNDELSVNDFTDQLFLSRSQLHRKIVALTNQSISEFIRNYRLDKAKTLLEQKTGNISEIAYQVGFKDAKYFSTTFKKRFGISPSEI